MAIEDLENLKNNGIPGPKNEYYFSLGIQLTPAYSYFYPTFLLQHWHISCY